MFKKGQSGNPRGRKPTPDFVKVVQQYSREFIECKIAEFMQRSMEDIKLISKNPNAQAIDAFLARIFLMGISLGDHQRLNFLFDRTIGKVPSTLSLQGDDNKPLTLNYNLND